MGKRKKTEDGEEVRKIKPKVIEYDVWTPLIRIFSSNRNGRVKSNADGICRVSGCGSAKVGSLAIIKTARAGLVPGLVLNINKKDISIVLLKEENVVRQGDFVFTKGKLLQISLTLGLFGKIINPIGEIISSKKQLRNFEGLGSIEKKAKGIIDRVPVRKPLMTGIKAVDNLIPIGMGQRELIIGDKQTGKTSIAIDTILNYSESNNNILKSSKKLILRQLRRIVWFVYCGIGQKKSTISNLYETLEESKWYTSIVSASASDSAAFQFLSPYTGTTVGEYIRDIIGGDCVIIYDDLSKHAVAYRQMSLLLRRPPGREAYPGDVFYVHSRLLERAGALINRIGKDVKKRKHIFKRGTLTALPVIETQAGDVSAYIPTNVISITDGQIFLESELFYKGIHPAINVGLSVSRVGSNAQHALLKLISGSLKVELAQYREVESFATFGAELDEHMMKLLFRGENLIEILKQDVNKPENMMSQIIQLFLGVGLNKKILETHKKLRESEDKFSSNFEYNSTKSWLETFRTSGINIGVENVKVFLNSIFTFIKNTNIGFFGNSRSSGEFLLDILYKNPSTFLNDIMTSFFLNPVKEEHILEFYDYRMSYYNWVTENQKGNISDSEISDQFRNFDALITTSEDSTISLRTERTINKKRNKRKFGTALRIELVNTLLETTLDGYRSFLDGNLMIDNSPLDWRVEFDGHPFDEPDDEYIRSKFYDDWTIYVADIEDKYRKNYVSRIFHKMKKRRRIKGIKTFKWNKFIITRLVYLYLSYFSSIIMSSIMLSGFYIGGSRKLLEFSDFEFEYRYGFLNTSQDEMLEYYIPGKDLENKTSSIFKLISKIII